MTSTTKALDLHTMTLPTRNAAEDESDDDDGSYEEESISSSDDESFFSYYSIDQLSTIAEETDLDLMSEMSKRSTRSRRGTGRSLRSIDADDDVAPLPPVRTRSQHGDSSFASRSPGPSPISTRSTSSPSTQSFGSASIQSKSPGSLRSRDGLVPPLYKTGTLNSVTETEADTIDGDSACWSAPLNDVDNEKAPLQRRSFLVSAQTGEEYMLSQSDDEYTFVSVNTGDDMSLVSDLGSSRHERTCFALEGSSRHSRTVGEGESSHQERTTFSLEDMEPLSDDHQRSSSAAQAGGKKSRRGSGISMSSADLLTIPEDGSSDGDTSSNNIADHELETPRETTPDVLDPLKRRQSFDLIRSRFDALGPILEHQAVNDPTDPSAQRMAVLKHRLKLERYSGVRRRKSFERSKKLLGKSFGRVKRSTFSEPTDLSALEQHQPLSDRLARFGGLTRRESFRNNKSEFEKKFDKEVKPLVNPLRRRRSLSPIARCEPEFDRSDFMLRMTKSDGHLVFNLKDLVDEEDENEMTAADDLVLDPKFEQKFKQRQEHFSGLRRRNSFKRSQRVLTKKFDKIQARSKEERERFGGLQRMNSYKQSRQLFERPRRGGRKKSTSLFVTPEDEPAYEGDDPAPNNSPRNKKNGPPSKSKSADWSCSLTRSRLREEVARRKLEEAFKDYQQTSADPEEYDDNQINPSAFDGILVTLEKSPTPVPANREVRRSRKGLQHTLTNPQQAARE